MPDNTSIHSLRVAHTSIDHVRATQGPHSTARTNGKPIPHQYILLRVRSHDNRTCFERSKVSNGYFLFCKKAFSISCKIVREVRNRSKVDSCYRKVAFMRPRRGEACPGHAHVLYDASFSYK